MARRYSIFSELYYVDQAASRTMKTWTNLREVDTRAMEGHDRKIRWCEISEKKQ